ncbi:MAG: NlpC/P60 family protein [Clostridiales bacterium]|nr:NlpC/P60 family protein [Clostridiales bacterium]
MKNKYLIKILCIYMSAAVLVAGTLSASAEGEQETAATEAVTAEPTATPAPTATPTPTATPVPESTSGAEPTQAPSSDDGSSDSDDTEDEGNTGSTDDTGDGAEATATPVPTEAAEVTPTPEPTVTEALEESVSESVQDIIDRINDLAQKEEITVEFKEEIEEIRTLYDALSDEEKVQVTNYETFEEIETAFTAALEAAAQEDEDMGETDGTQETEDTDDLTDETTETTAASVGTAVYLTDVVSNLHAGNQFYLNSLQENYQLSFSDDFADVMEEIEEEYKEKNKLADASDLSGSSVTTSSDTLLVRNWQDILAIYVYEQSLEGAESYTLDSSCKDDLAEIFAEMNPVVRDKSDITKVSYGEKHIEDYIEENDISGEDQEILEKYLEKDCELLCAVVTAAKGFVRQSVGDSVSEERVNVITAAYSLVGQVGYFWGGKSTAIGMDSSWGSVTTVSAEGSSSTGTLRAYGLDCSGFVTWAVINGYEDTSMGSVVGDGTSEQWENAASVSEADAQPGDLVFQNTSASGSDNHVGILCGQTESGDWIVVHCSSSQNGVTVGEAYSAGFRYIRQATFYPAVTETEDNSSSVSVLEDTKDADAASVNDAAETGDSVATSGDAAGETGDTVATSGDAAAETGDTVATSGDAVAEIDAQVTEILPLEDESEDYADTDLTATDSDVDSNYADPGTGTTDTVSENLASVEADFADPYSAISSYITGGASDDTVSVSYAGVSVYADSIAASSDEYTTISAGSSGSVFAANTVEESTVETLEFVEELEMDET